MGLRPLCANGDAANPTEPSRLAVQLGVRSAAGGAICGVLCCVGAGVCLVGTLLLLLLLLESVDATGAPGIDEGGGGRDGQHDRTQA